MVVCVSRKDILRPSAPFLPFARRSRRNCSLQSHFSLEGEIRLRYTSTSPLSTFLMQATDFPFASITSTSMLTPKKSPIKTGPLILAFSMERLIWLTFGLRRDGIFTRSRTESLSLSVLDGTIFVLNLTLKYFVPPSPRPSPKLLLMISIAVKFMSLVGLILTTKDSSLTLPSSASWSSFFSNWPMMLLNLTVPAALQRFCCLSDSSVIITAKNRFSALKSPSLMLRGT